jgi:putative restriction endonuclease
MMGISAAMPYIANTDWNWFQSFAQREPAGEPIHEVNFWQPISQKPMAGIASGSPLFFRLKKPRYSIAGYGFFSHFVVLKMEEAWDWFGEANGHPDMEAFFKVIGGYRKKDLLGDPAGLKAPLGCSVLRDCVFWPEERWVPWGREMGFAPNVVQGKYERDTKRASQLLGEVQFDSMVVPEDLEPGCFKLVDVDTRELVLAKRRERKGQGAFRSRLLEPYERRCAITGEHTELVLDAAHIQPYLGPASNHIQNGMLLTKEFHALFDEGYVTVTPDYMVRVSGRLREEWQNGHRYYPFDGQKLLVLPEHSARPSQEALAWHGEQVFLE